MLKCKFLDVSHISSCLATAVFFDAGNILHFHFLPKHGPPPLPTLLSFQIGPSPPGSHHRCVAGVAKIYSDTEFAFTDDSSDMDNQYIRFPKGGQELHSFQVVEHRLPSHNSSFLSQLLAV